MVIVVIYSIYNHPAYNPNIHINPKSPVHGEETRSLPNSSLLMIPLLFSPFSFSPHQLIYEDSMDLIAKLPCVAAKIYRNLYREGSSIGAIDPKLDWSHNFTNMLGYTDAQFTELMRLYLTIHRWGRPSHQVAGLVVNIKRNSLGLPC